MNQDGQRRTAYELLSYSDIDMGTLEPIWPELAALPKDIREPLETEARYSVYMDRQKADIVSVQREEERLIPATFEFSELPGLSNELKQKLSRIRPANVAQAARIEGMTPAAVSLLITYIRKHELGHELNRRAVQ